MFYVVDESTGNVLRFGSGEQIIQEGERVVKASDDLDPLKVRFVGDDPVVDRRNT